MKILCAEYNPEKELTVVPIGDNALLRNNDDFFIPEFAAEWSCVPQIVVKISRLGKSIGERFAERYYEEIGVGIRFYAEDYARRLRTIGLPAGVASAFDQSAAISRLLKKDTAGEMSYEFRVNGRLCFEGSVEKCPLSVRKLIAVASDFYTLKIGDFLYCGNTFRYSGLKQDDRLQVSLNGIGLMDFKLK